MKRKEIHEAIANDKDASDTMNAIKFMQAVKEGDVEVEFVKESEENN